MRKFISYAFFGALSKHWAGSRALTDRERRGLILMIYSLVAQVMWYQYKADKVHKELSEDVDKLLDMNKKDLEDYKKLRLERDSLRQELQTIRPLDEVQKDAIKKFDNAALPYTWTNIAKFYETELSTNERRAFQFDKNRFRDALTGTKQ